MNLEEYIEKILSDAYKREGDQEENVQRSLPFFAASLAVIAAILGVVARNFPKPSWNFYPWTLYLLVGLIFISVCIIFYHLWQAVKPRPFTHIMKEDALVSFARETRSALASQRIASWNVDSRAIAHVRNALIDQYATATVASREINVARIHARGRALRFLILALLFSFLLIAHIFIMSLTDAAPAASGDMEEANVSDQRSQEGASGGSNDAPPAADAGGDGRHLEGHSNLPDDRGSEGRASQIMTLEADERPPVPVLEPSEPGLPAPPPPQTIPKSR
ncbi:hypothetical protein [Inquilinus sp. CAU 1745]|uniref:hypothetical protein n=1 Tax=Inquilinus sp. CAU 1745 TaxID=3140369 RepID=UPI00325A544E